MKTREKVLATYSEQLRRTGNYFLARAVVQQRYGLTPGRLDQVLRAARRGNGRR